jgi:hypothetical protein
LIASQWGVVLILVARNCYNAIACKQQMKRTQINTRLLPATVSRIAKECQQRRATNDMVVQTALDHWFTSMTPEEREKFYRSCAIQPFAGNRKKKTVAKA